MDQYLPTKARVRRGALKFDQRRSRAQIVALAKMLEANNADHSLEGEAMLAGARIRRGSRDIAELQMIAAWKSPRQALLANNPPELVVEALDIACTAKSERITSTAMSALSEVGLTYGFAHAATVLHVSPERDRRCFRCA